MKLILLAAFSALATAKPSSKDIAPRGILSEVPVTNIGPIVGGDKAAANEFPWQATLQYYSAKYGDWYHFCDGSLISTNYVITAAQCLDDMARVKIRVVLGDHVLNIVEDSEQVINVKSFSVHENYRSNAPGKPNDIAVVRLSESAVFNSYVQPIAYSEAADEFTASDVCFISGWGRTEGLDQTSAPMTLQKTEMNVVSPETCRTKWGSYTQASHICVNYQNIDRSACKEDYGVFYIKRRHGRSVRLEREGTYVLAGIVSWGSSKCGRALPNIYTRLSGFRSWIDGKLSP